MITRNEFEILHKSYVASFDAFEQQSRAMEMIVFGDECHSGWDSPDICVLHAKVKDYKVIMNRCISSGFNRTWIENSDLSRYIRQAERQVERHLQEAKTTGDS